MALEYHEPPEELTEETREVHRAIASLIEELEAVDWYQNRIDVTKDEEMKAILEHNRDEEMEHAAMALEWLRRRLPKFDEELRTYLFTTGSIVGQEEGEHGDGHSDGNSAASGGLGIGGGRKKGA